MLVPNIGALLYAMVVFWAIYYLSFYLYWSYWHLQIALAEKENKEKGISDTSDGEASQEVCNPLIMLVFVATGIFRAVPEVWHFNGWLQDEEVVKGIAQLFTEMGESYVELIANGMSEVASSFLFGWNGSFEEV